MSLELETVTIRSDQHFGKRVPPKALGELLRTLPEAIRYSIRMAFESRSEANGKRPRWLSASSDIRFVDHGGDDETILYFEAPRLGEAAAELYKQKEFWPSRPSQSDTGFDLFGDVIKDVTANNADSGLFDRRLLQQVERFKKGLNGTFQQIEFAGGRYSTIQPAVLNDAVIQSASKLSHNTPAPQQVRIWGKLDMVRSSTNTFAVKLKDGQEARGVLIDGKVSQLTELLEADVLILGKAVYRPSGSLLRIDAYQVVRADEGDEFFSFLPKPKRTKFDLRDVVRHQHHKRGIDAIFGQWPGDETDEELAAALKEIG